MSVTDQALEDDDTYVDRIKNKCYSIHKRKIYSLMDIVQLLHSFFYDTIKVIQLKQKKIAIKSQSVWL